MRYLILCAYWAGTVLLLALLLMSFDYGFGRALFVASSMLPGMLCAQCFLPQALTVPRRRWVAVAGVAMGAVVVEWVAMLLANRYTQVAAGPREEFPALFSNPVFLSILLAAFVFPGECLSRWLRRRLPRPRSITFISERHKVTLPFAAILYVESNDCEVLLHTTDGSVYRTRTRISQWERLLDDRFVRIHRAYLVNADFATSVSAQSVEVGGIRIECSRKYRETAIARLVRQA